MRITIDITDELLSDVLSYTGETKKSPAVARVVEEFIKRQKAKEFGNKILEGEFDYPSTAEEIQELDR
jgi:Arc/MetJ family transcription regulator